MSGASGSPQVLRVALAGILTGVLLAGCGGGKRASAENDKLRSENMQLQDRIADLEQEQRELAARLALYERDSPVAPAVLKNTPRVSSIAIEGRSHARDTSGDGRSDELLVYVIPADGRGRFVQMVGDLSVHTAWIPADGDPVSLGRVALGPAEIREAYRSAFSGTHYTIAVPLQLPDDLDLEHAECTVSVEFVDGHTGARQHTQEVVGLAP